MTLCFDDSMATMSAQDPVFDTSFHPRLLHPRLWGSWLAVALLSLLAWVPARARDKLADYLAPAAARLQEAGLHRRHQPPRSASPSRRGGPSGPAAEIHPGGAQDLPGLWRADLAQPRLPSRARQGERLGARGSGAGSRSPRSSWCPHTWAVDMIGRYLQDQDVHHDEKPQGCGVRLVYQPRGAARAGVSTSAASASSPPSRPCAAATASSICRIRITAGRRASSCPSSTTPRRPCRPCPSW